MSNRNLLRSLAAAALTAAALLSAPVCADDLGRGTSNDDWKGFTVLKGGKGYVQTPMGQLQNLPAELKDSMSSLQWNVPPGVVVVFYQDAGGLKQQAAIWGIGQFRNIDTWDFNDKVSRWAWYQLGSAEKRIASGDR